MSDTLARFVDGLKARLRSEYEAGERGERNKWRTPEGFYSIDEWCGSTETGFHDETYFDFDLLLKEIDTFAAGFNK